jgi:hypothetical protein
MIRILVILLLAACATPMRSDPTTLVGTWSAPGLTLRFHDNGTFTYHTPDVSWSGDYVTQRTTIYMSISQEVHGGQVTQNSPAKKVEAYYTLDGDMLTIGGVSFHREEML